jgi:tRNA G46 methylase TrmB
MNNLFSLAQRVKADKNTWKREMKYTTGMQKRGGRMLNLASELVEWRKVVDIGCGNQQLRDVVAQLNPKAQYIGIDRLKHQPDTLIADFNKGEFPEVSADLAVVSGVLEYIQPDMVDAFLNNVCGAAPLVAI